MEQPRTSVSECGAGVGQPQIRARGLERGWTMLRRSRRILGHQPLFIMPNLFLLYLFLLRPLETHNLFLFTPLRRGRGCPAPPTRPRPHPRPRPRPHPRPRPRRVTTRTNTPSYGRPAGGWAPCGRAAALPAVVMSTATRAGGPLRGAQFAFDWRAMLQWREFATTWLVAYQLATTWLERRCFATRGFVATRGLVATPTKSCWPPLGWWHTTLHLIGHQWISGIPLGT